MSTIYRKSESVVTREIAGETLLIPVTGSLADMQEIFALDEVSAAIWEALDGQRTLEDVFKVVTEMFEVTADAAATDTQAFLAELCGSGLVEAV
jgi:hypothetical protein